ncbi:MAG: CRISPR system precrRNA processing endoribonuclease RAMP protein Cas6, partial [Spirochaetia bacterium]
PAGTGVTLTVRFFGNAASYLPYVYYALVRAAERGVSGGRGFSIERVLVDQQMTEADSDHLALPSGSVRITIPPVGGERIPYRLLLSAQSPVRIKARGAYLEELDFTELWIAASRRVLNVLDHFGQDSQQYNQTQTAGDPAQVPPSQNEQWRGQWQDTRYRSKSQAGVLRLGGLVGSFSAVVWLSDGERAVLKACEVVHLGKNATFGLGQVLVALEPQGG